MAEIVNLRRVRKQRRREAADQQAEQNRVSFGRSKAERALADVERSRAERGLDGHRLERDGDEPTR